MAGDYPTQPLPGTTWPVAELVQHGTPQFHYQAPALYSPPADLSAIAKALDKLVEEQSKLNVLIARIVEVLEAKPKVCPTCSRISGHQSWCGQGTSSG